MRLGLQELLAEEGLDVLVEENRQGEELVDRVVEVLPDVVVLDLDTDGNDAVAKEITATFPSVKVIACSSVEPRMRVFPPFHRGEYYETQLSPMGFVEAIKQKG